MDLVGGVAELLADWLAVRGEHEGPLFTSVRYKGGKALAAQTVYDMLKKRAKLAGIKSISPHDFRRTTAGDLLAAGVDIVTTQKLLGHANPATTAKYDRRGKEARCSKAASKLSVPYTHREVASETSDGGVG